MLATRPATRTDHFALHHLAKAVTPELSTVDAPRQELSVDDLPVRAGVVIPKRHARRAVTRSLLKRQVRAALARHAPVLQAGWWIVRLRAPFDRTRFASAASAELRSAVGRELDTLFGALPRPAPLP